MMATLLEMRDFTKRFYAKYSAYVNPSIKFILSLITFLMINGKIGFMAQLRSPLVAVLLALVCAFLPLNGTVLLAGGLMLVHAYSLSMEACAVTAGLLAVMYLLYFRISSKMAVLLVMTPICFLLGIPAVIPLVGGLLFGPGAAIPAGCGTLIYYLMKYMSQNSTSLGTGELQTGATKVASLLESLVSNRAMFLCIAAMMLTVMVVYLIRRLSADHSWELAICIGIVFYIVVNLLGAFLPEADIRIVSLLLGCAFSVLLAFLVKFFVFSVDYSRTERVQFEDDEYYYYVKAIPKNAIAAPKKTVKKIASQKKQTKTIKRIE